MSDVSLGSQGLGVPQTFRTAAGNIIASYDFYDAASGLGYKKFYAGVYKDYAGADDVYFLTGNNSISSPSTAAMTSCAAGSSVTLTFDYTFTNPMVVGAGEAYVNETTSYDSTSGDGYVKAEVFHVNLAGEETLLGTETSFIIYNSQYARHLQRFMVPTKPFGVGEKLRLKITFYARDIQGYIYHDPASGVSLTESGLGRALPISLVLSLPFRIQT